MAKKLRFEPKKPQKNRLPGSTGLGHRAALKRFGIVLYGSDDAQIYRMAFELDAQGDPTFKNGNFSLNKMRFEPKNLKKMIFMGSSSLH